MKDIIKNIDNLELFLFKNIFNQTSDEYKRSLLAVQRITANTNCQYTYLEIGSYLGGSIQTHLLDRRCKKIYSIDSRPFQVPDDRSPGSKASYKGNSTERMLQLLRDVDPKEVFKIRCFEMVASEVDPQQIDVSPQIAFIDGQHTKNAVLSDFEFCYKVIDDHGTILFHDLGIVYPAIIDICKDLDKRHRNYLPLQLGINVFGIFFDATKVYSDPFLNLQYKRNKHILLQLRLKRWLKSVLPRSVWRTVTHIYKRKW